MSSDTYRMGFWDGHRSFGWRGRDLRDGETDHDYLAGYDAGFALAERNAKGQPEDRTT